MRMTTGMGLAAALLAGLAGAARGADGQRTVADALWIWGHPAGVYNKTFLLPTGRASSIEPVAAADAMGVRNMIFVGYDGKPQPPFENYYAPFRTLDRVYWSLVGASGVTSAELREAAFSLAEKSDNLAGWILDDFFRTPCAGNADEALSGSRMPESAQAAPLSAALTPAELRRLGQRKVRGRKLPLMAVVYTGQLTPGARAHLAEVDQLCLWTWRPADLKNLAANFAALEKLAPKQELFLGCYTYDFNESKPLPSDLMRQQVELGYEWLKAGRIKGLIFLATANVDVGLEAVEWTRRWIRETGRQALPAAAKE